MVGRVGGIVIAVTYHLQDWETAPGSKHSLSFAYTLYQSDGVWLLTETWGTSKVALVDHLNGQNNQKKHV